MMGRTPGPVMTARTPAEVTTEAAAIESSWREALGVPDQATPNALTVEDP